MATIRFTPDTNRFDASLLDTLVVLANGSTVDLEDTGEPTDPATPENPDDGSTEEPAEEVIPADCRKVRIVPKKHRFVPDLFIKGLYIYADEDKKDAIVKNGRLYGEITIIANQREILRALSDADVWEIGMDGKERLICSENKNDHNLADEYTARNEYLKPCPHLEAGNQEDSEVSDSGVDVGVVDGDGSDDDEVLGSGSELEE